MSTTDNTTMTNNTTMADSSTMTDNSIIARNALNVTIQRSGDAGLMTEENANDLFDRITRIQINTAASEAYSDNVTNGGVLITSLCILWCVVLYNKLFFFIKIVFQNIGLR